MDPGFLDKFSFGSIVVSSVTGLFGVFIGLLVQAAFLLQSWVGPARTAFRFPGRMKKMLSEARPVRGVGSVAVTLIVPPAQVCTLGLCFLGGNYMSMIFHESRWRAMVDAFGSTPSLQVTSFHEVLTPSWIIESYQTLARFLVWDPISEAYVALAFLILLASYRMAYKGSDLRNAGYVLALPASLCLGAAWITAVLCLLVGVVIVGIALLSLLFTGKLPWSVSDWNDFLRALPPFAAGVVASFAYFGACQAAIRGSKLVVLSWIPQSSK
jgi:hypothetical protein